LSLPRTDSGALRFVATVPRGFADLLATELTSLGADNVRDSAGGVSFEGSLETGYRACLESRLASRVLLQVARAPVADTAAFYDLGRTVDWTEHLDPRGTLSCEFTGKHDAINNTHFGALKLKDAICDGLRDATGERPSIQTQRPDLRVHAHAQRGEISLLIDLAGESLSQRGYRLAGGEAPLRENLAAGILMRAGWPRIAAEGGEFLDPMCGSGTFAIEAAWIATGTAPGLLRDYWGFQGWRGHDTGLWERLKEAARARALQQVPVIVRGADRNRAAIATAAANSRRAGVGRDLLFEHSDIAELRAKNDAADAPPGLFCVNPPYGQRITGTDEAADAHRAIGVALREHFTGWNAVVITGEPALGQLIGCEASRVHTVWNGAIECRLLRFAPGERKQRRSSRGVVIDAPEIAQTTGAQMFANRLRKNLQRLGKQARREGVGCWRLYDADMPEYALAVDLYTGTGPDEGERWLYVQEYAAPHTVDPAAARRRREEALSVLPEVTGIALDHVHLRTRRRQKDGGQYSKLNRREEFHVVEEGGLKVRVNLDDYLDTGLFLDHRLTRQRLGAAAKGTRFLNLFCYTGVASLHAAGGGARSTLGIDLSRTYLDWARANLELNGFTADRHDLLQADCMQWLADQQGGAPAFDLVFLDPPTFSNSARMQGVLDIQRDHAMLVRQCMGLLAREGLLVFSTNAQKFAFDPGVSEQFRVSDISSGTLPFDFQGNPRIHRCFELRHA
jgi:23S rRNA (guanine2445-N2)-methyltransferase / 23S rRNA (guanine2069-N7)-methyltransferase